MGSRQHYHGAEVMMMWMVISIVVFIVFVIVSALGAKGQQGFDYLGLPLVVLMAMLVLSPLAGFLLGEYADADPPIKWLKKRRREL